MSADCDVPERETHWLVERKGANQYIKSAFGSGLTVNVWQAHRFTSEREAFDFVQRCDSFKPGELAAVEHMFINKVITDGTNKPDGRDPCAKGSDALIEA